MWEQETLLLVDTKVLPEVFAKVVQAKKLMAAGKVTNLSQAAKMAGISRSALYKYKDYVHSYDQNSREDMLTLISVLEDKPGVLSLVMAELCHHNCNILTVNQNIPSDGVAHVSISFKASMMTNAGEQLALTLRKLDGVVEAKITCS